MILRLLLMIATFCCGFMLGGRGGTGAMCAITCVLEKEVYDKLTSVATQFCKVLMLESVPCRQFWGVSSNISDMTQNEQHVGNMLAAYHAKGTYMY